MNSIKLVECYLICDANTVYMHVYIGNVMAPNFQLIKYIVILSVIDRYQVP